MKDWFNKSSFVVYENIESLLLKTIKGEDTSCESEYIKQIYNDEVNITQFEIEVDILRVIFYEKKKDCFDSFLPEIRKLPREQHLLLSRTVHICKLSAAEQSFSTTRGIKWMRSKMIPVRFNALSILKTHKTFTKNLN